MKWEYVFNSNLIAIAGSHIDTIQAIVKQTGYKFFTFNGQVVSTDSKEYIGIDVDELI